MKTNIATDAAPPTLCCPVTDIAPVSTELTETAAAFKALSDPTRLRMLKAIAHVQEACECNIVPEFGLSQPTISYHLKVLREAGLIVSERRGQWVWHSINRRTVLGAARELTEIAE
jgi:ArsR family transcriptional regulator